MRPGLLDELSKAVSDALPKDINALRDDLDHNIRAALAGVLSRMNLVSREEFEVQQKVLARTREKLEQLEKQLQELEQK